MLKKYVSKLFVFLWLVLGVQAYSMGMAHVDNSQDSDSQVKCEHGKTMSVVVQINADKCIKNFSGNHTCNKCQCWHSSVIPITFSEQITRLNFVAISAQTIMPYLPIYLYPPFRPPII